jgi:hypothetical protein
LLSSVAFSPSHETMYITLLVRQLKPRNISDGERERGEPAISRLPADAYGEGRQYKRVVLFCHVLKTLPQHLSVSTNPHCKSLPSHLLGIDHYPAIKRHQQLRYCNATNRRCVYSRCVRLETCRHEHLRGVVVYKSISSFVWALCLISHSHFAIVWLLSPLLCSSRVVWLVGCLFRSIRR